MRKRKLSPVPPDQVRREDILTEETPETPAAAAGREDVLRQGAGPAPAGRPDVLREGRPPAPAGRQDVLREGRPPAPAGRQDVLQGLVRRRRQDILRDD